VSRPCRRDRQELGAVLSEVQGAAVGDWGRLKPTERADARVRRIAEFRTALGPNSASPPCAGTSSESSAMS